jgi:hypothetical protein
MQHGCWLSPFLAIAPSSVHGDVYGTSDARPAKLCDPTQRVMTTGRPCGKAEWIRQTITDRVGLISFLDPNLVNSWPNGWTKYRSGQMIVKYCEGLFRKMIQP